MNPTYSYVVNFESKWGEITTKECMEIGFGGDRRTVEQITKSFFEKRWDDDVIVSITELEHTTTQKEIWNSDRRSRDLRSPGR